MIAFFAVGNQAALAAVVAGSTITNVASLVDGSGLVATSNAAVTRVDEVLDIALAALARPADADRAYPFLLTNGGNGREAFVLSGAVGGDAQAVRGFAVDADADGRYDPATDRLLADGAVTGELAAAEALHLLALLTEDAPTSGSLSISAHARTGSGTLGTLFAGKGDAGGDAIVGRTTAAASLAIALGGDGTGGKAPRISLRKRQSVRAPDGSDRPVPGAIITYTLEAVFDGAGPVSGVRVTDPVPAGAVFIPGSITLDRAPLTDAGDADAARFDGGAVAVALGEVAAPVTRTISFQVSIQ